MKDETPEDIIKPVGSEWNNAFRIWARPSLFSVFRISIDFKSGTYRKH
jgi:hypothetical protein